MSFNWKKFYDVGLFLLDYSEEEEYQRSGIGRLYYACFGESRAYYKKAFLRDLPSKESHKTLIKSLENSIYEEEQELGEYLHRLRNSRNRADYKAKLKKYDVKNSKKNAKLILELLDEFDKNPIRPI